MFGLSRSALYYTPVGESAENLALMRRIDELHLHAVPVLRRAADGAPSGA